MRCGDRHGGWADARQGGDKAPVHESEAREEQVAVYGAEGGGVDAEGGGGIEADVGVEMGGGKKKVREVVAD